MPGPMPQTRGIPTYLALREYRHYRDGTTRDSCRVCVRVEGEGMPGLHLASLLPHSSRAVYPQHPGKCLSLDISHLFRHGKRADAFIEFIRLALAVLKYGLKTRPKRL